MAACQRILVVEDDADLRRMLRQVLTFGGYDVIEAGDGLDALRLIDATAVDGVILDLGLPLISGQTVSQEVAANAHTRHIPIIVLTAQPGNHDDLDVACVLRKPVDPDRILSAVQSCIASGGSAITPS